MTKKMSLVDNLDKLPYENWGFTQGQMAVKLQSQNLTSLTISLSLLCKQW